MQTEIGGLRGDMQTEIGGLRGEMTSKVDGLRGEMNDLRGDIKSMQRLMLYGFFTLGGIILASGGIHFG
jgi:hypothetical protein